MDTIDSDLSARMLAIELEVRALHSPIDRMAAGVTQSWLCCQIPPTVLWRG